ncbi:DUF7601 domain-containing protein, partial [Paenibacillus polymyxa]|uniref:DUF7601 domain-containing protein n=1 Tax=Paenibacillus polymyxa TaxID=1406 RepID=UPI00201E30DF
NLTLQYNLDAPVVYDLLVHGDSLDVLNNLDANPKVTSTTLEAIKSQIDTKQLWQKYRENTLTVSNGLNGEVIPLTVNGERVADLIKVTGYKGDVPGSVSFESVTTNPDNLFRQDNAGNTWSNRGLLFDGDDYVSRAEANTSNLVRMLNKEMLYANTTGLEGVAADWNRNYSGQWSDSIWKRTPVASDPNWYMDNSRPDNYILAGYDRKDRTVTFRLAVNMPGFNTEEMAKDGGTRVASDIKLVDVLPEGWEFVDYAPGEAYRLYKGGTGYRTDGKGGSGRYAQAVSVIAPGTPQHVVSFIKDGNEGTFTFSKLESPYVILVKARPTNAALANYKLGNNNAGENQAMFSMKWGDKPYSATEAHRIIVPVQSLSKTVQKPVSGVQEWTVNYTPPFEMKPGVYLLDTLAKGLKLRQNAEGGLSLEPSDIAVYPGKLKPDGTLERNGGPLNLADPNSEVKVTAGTDPATGGSTLRFDFVDPNKFYQIVYQTESQGMQPGTAGNSIKLMGDDSLPPIGAQSSIMLDANDVAGSANENGLLFLKKVGPDGTTPLKDVKFQLLNPDGTPARDKENNVMAEKTTGTDGKTNFIIQVPGDYLLKQTYIDLLTYLPTTTIYRVRVIDAPGKPVLVDGQKVESNNPLIVPTPAEGKLTISNKVKGNGSDKTKEFEYTVSFAGAGKDESYSYVKSDGDKGSIKSGGTLRLKDGETLDVLDLPKNLTYTVTQKDYTTDEYMTTPGERYYTGVMKGKDEVAPFKNMRVMTGSLLISNKVQGNGGNKTKAFKYKVTFTGEGANGSYSYEKSDGSKGTIKSGDTFELKDEELFIVEGLPTYLQYTVTEDNYTDDGYVTDPASLIRTGTIPVKSAAEAHFVNTRQLPVLEGVLRDNNTREVIPNASITVTNLKTGEKQTIQTNEKGEYSVIAEAATDYTITFTKWYPVGGKDVPVEFTQKANVDSSVTDETVPADITAVGIVLLKQPEGQTSLLDSKLAGKMHIYLRDASNQYVVDKNGAPKAFNLESNGVFSADGLAAKTYKMEVRYEVAPGQELTVLQADLDVKANGELNISQGLVDPYGIITDATTGMVIEGAEVTLYYADTPGNTASGIVPGTKVTLPAIPGFAPNDNASPSQNSDANGAYAYMVFPNTDYYLVVTKAGYDAYTSPTISVGSDIVRHDIQLKPISSGGGGGGNSGGSGGGTGSGSGSSGTDNSDDGASNVNNGASNVNNGAGNVNSGASNVNNGASNVNNGASNVDNGASNVDNGASNVDNGASNVNNGASNVDNGASNVNNGAGNVNNEINKGNKGNNASGSVDNEVANGDYELDDAPKTGDSSPSPIFYMVLALISLITSGFCLLSGKKKKHIQ